MTHTSLFDPDPPPIQMDVADLVHRYGYAAVLAEVQMHTPLHAVPTAPARATDPETSQEAGTRSADVSRFSERSRSGRLLRTFVADAYTDYEATARVVGATAPPTVWDGCRRRCSDLRAAGYLCDTGQRRKNPLGDEAIVWQLTLAGQRAIENLDATGWSR